MYIYLAHVGAVVAQSLHPTSRRSSYLLNRQSTTPSPTSGDAAPALLKARCSEPRVHCPLRHAGLPLLHPRPLGSPAATPRTLRYTAAPPPRVRPPSLRIARSPDGYGSVQSMVHPYKRAQRGSSSRPGIAINSAPSGTPRAPPHPVRIPKPASHNLRGVLETIVLVRDRGGAFPRDHVLQPPCPISDMAPVHSP